MNKFIQTINLLKSTDSSENKISWGAKSALACYIVVIAAVLLVALALALSLGYIGLDYENPAYPLSLIAIPINEITIFIVTFLFARKSKVSISKLGFKKVTFGLAIKMVLLAIVMLILTSSTALIQNAILGPDPSEQIFAELVSPKDIFQLSIFVIFSMLMVGPAEEMFARGYVQQGLESSLGKIKGWVLASILFGMLHALNILRAIAPTLVAGLFLGLIWQKFGRNTTAVAIMHGVYDSIALTLAFLALS